MQYNRNRRTYSLLRFPTTTDKSLKPISAADELLLDWSDENPTDLLSVYHDRFGVLAICSERRVRFVSSFHSQREALSRNVGKGTMPAVVSPLDELSATELAVMRIPKTLDLFELYLAQIARSASPETRVAAGFMTRHFSPRMLEIAGAYAGAVEQSKAKKKARLLILSDFKTDQPSPADLIKRIDFNDQEYRQYYGVFSADHIDYATQFLLESWDAVPELSDLTPPKSILDIGCGNGVIGNELSRRYLGASITSIDDSVLAVASARLNLPPGRAEVICDHSLSTIADAGIDLAVTNPPFHFGHENNIDVSLGLFKEARRVLRPGGHLVIVANRHLNYATHLSGLFKEVLTVAENEKFVVYRCA